MDDHVHLSSFVDTLTLCLNLQLQIPVLEYGTRLRRQHGALGRLVLRLKIVTDLLHRHPFNPLKLVDVFDDTVHG